MRLGTRILISYGYLATLLVVGAAGAALSFNLLGDTIGNVLGENFRSVQAGIAMLESLERQDSATLSMLLGQAEGRPRLAEADTAFYAALEAARSNITIEAENDIIARIATRYEAYRDVREEVLERPSAERLADYEQRAFAMFADIKASVLELIDVNHEAMQRADERARGATTTNAALHGLLVALALLSLAPLSASMRRHVLNRLEEIGAVSDAIAEGDLGRRLDERHDDELGLTARQLNRVLDRYQVLEAELAGHRVHESGMVQALLRELPWKAVLFSTSGAVVDSTLDAATEELVHRAAEERVEAMDEPVAAQFDIDGRRVRLVPLSPDDRPQLAWLALVTDPDGGVPLETS